MILTRSQSVMRVKALIQNGHCSEICYPFRTFSRNSRGVRDAERFMKHVKCAACLNASSTTGATRKDRCRAGIELKGKAKGEVEGPGRIVGSRIEVVTVFEANGTDNCSPANAPARGNQTN